MEESSRLTCSCKHEGDRAQKIKIDKLQQLVKWLIEISISNMKIYIIFVKEGEYTLTGETNTFIFDFLFFP